jgi:hypothetical protein
MHLSLADMRTLNQLLHLHILQNTSDDGVGQQVRRHERQHQARRDGTDRLVVLNCTLRSRNALSRV